VSGYNYPEIADLVRQLAFSPGAVRRTQLANASDLVDRLSAADAFTFDAVCFHITGYRPAKQGGRVFIERLLANDLRKLLLDVSESLGLKAASFGEPVYSTSDLNRLFALSPATIARWRRLGLKAFKFIFPDGIRRLGFTPVFISQFARNRAKVQGRFRSPGHLVKAVEEELVVRARVLARQGMTYEEVQLVLGGEFAVESITVRRIIEQHDRANPKSAVFPQLGRPLKARDCRLMYGALRAGFGVCDIAVVFDRPRNVVYRAILRHKARLIAERRVDYMPNELFDHPEADRIILAPAEGPAAGYRDQGWDTPTDDDPKAPAFARELRRCILLTPQRERYLFRRYNYLKFKIVRLRRELDMSDPSLGELHRLASLFREARAARNEILRANLRLAASVARRHVTPNVRLSDLVSEANVSLMKAAEKFDYARGYRFSTYATWAIYKNFAKSVPASARTARRFVTGQDKRLDATPAADIDPLLAAESAPPAHRVVDELMACLSEREKTIITKRYALQPGVRSTTLSALGRELDMSRERIRQLEVQALAKMRKAADPAVARAFD